VARAEPSAQKDEASGSPSSTVTNRIETMTMIEIVAGDRRLTAHIGDAPMAREFLAQLPLELSLKDFGGNNGRRPAPTSQARGGVRRDHTEDGRPHILRATR
tara:strand:- start:4007 stop:4312 length:306 start_codon:yes stop_codon:yes gene_type:complete